MVYLNYYSKMKNSLTGDYDAMVASAQGKIVTKEIQTSKLTAHQQADLRAKSITLAHKVGTWIVNNQPLSGHYSAFRIPKHSGGYRTLHAPDAELKSLQQEILKFLVKDCKILCHNAVHSYVKHRNCKTALEAHKKTGARWFLKVDLRNFFDNCVYDEVIRALAKIHPLSVLDEVTLGHIICVCFLDGKLPQGAPTSPLLSNLYLQHFDHTLSKDLRTYTYTRYADDLLISSTKSFMFSPIVTKIVSYLPGGLHIAPAKTRYGSCNGNNWNLGLMYNQERELTVGYRNKHLIKNRIHNLFTCIPAQDTQEYELWLVVVRELKGLLAYYKFIEPEYFTQLIQRYKDKGYDL